MSGAKHAPKCAHGQSVEWHCTKCQQEQHRAAGPDTWIMQYRETRDGPGWDILGPSEKNPGGIYRSIFARGVYPKARAAHIVACVNFCAGIPTDDLNNTTAEGIEAVGVKGGAEWMKGALVAISERKARGDRQQAELIKALRSISKLVGIGGSIARKALAELDAK